ncbi:MAG: putative Ig domain-containing protein [Chloroflexota bacterium]
MKYSLLRNAILVIVLCFIALSQNKESAKVYGQSTSESSGGQTYIFLPLVSNAPNSNTVPSETGEQELTNQQGAEDVTQNPNGNVVDGVFYRGDHDDAYLAKLTENEPPFVVTEDMLRAASANNVGGQWGPVLDWPHVPVSVANLPDGRILTWSGSERRTWPSTEQSYTATWDPATGTFAEYFNDNHNMFCSDLVSLDDGRVFVLGGRNTVQFTSIFDASTNSWTRLGDMSSSRWYPSSMSLADGGVFTLAGKGGPYPEVWTQEAGWRQLTGANIQSAILDYGTNKDGAGWWPLVHQDPRGNILHYGATPVMHSINPNGNGSITSLGNNNFSWYPEENIAIMYDEGKILVAGGAQSSSTNTSSDKAATIDIRGTTPQIANISTMNYARQFGNEVVLPTGQVLVIGGNTTGTKFSDSGAVMEPEVWDPSTGTWTLMNPMAVPRTYHSTAILLPDGRVFSGGGGYSSGNANHPATHQDAEIFSPPYLFSGNGSLATRPQISSAPEVIAAGETFTVNTSQSIQKFTMVRMSATTHTMNTGQRFLNVAFTGSNNSYQLTANRNINVIIPGYWMLFAINSSGVPSIAKIVQVVRGDENNLAPDGTVTQSSVAYDGVPERANDGNPSGHYPYGSVTHTATELQPWWEIDLKSVAEIDSISLWNRSDCCIDRLRNFYILISDVPFISQDLDEARNQADVTEIFVPSQVNGRQQFDVGRTGRYVRIQKADNGILSLAEVQISGRREREINYDYFHGSWNNLPDFSNPAPPLIKSGTVDTFTIGPREQDDNFGFHFEGTLNVPSNGTYTFFTRSDDGSKLWINDQLVVSNDGTHGMVEKSGTISLSAGQHNIRVDYFERAGGQGLEVRYAGPGISKQLIPTSVLSQLSYDYYHGTWSSLPDFSGPVLVKSGTVDTFTIEPRERDNEFGFRFRGTVYLPTDGTYTFYTTSDDGSKLWINEQLVVSNDGTHPMIEKSGTVSLNEGLHTIRVEYFERGGGQGLEVRYAGPGIPKQPIDLMYQAFPQIETVENQVGMVGDTVNLAISATEPEGETLTYSAIGLPPGLTINSTSGTIAGPKTINSIGSYDVEVTASDPDGNYDTAEFSWVVSNVPNCEPIDFSAYTIQSVGGNQDQGQAEVLDNGMTLKVSNNAWKGILQPYSMTPNLMLEFDFKSTLLGEEHAVGFGTSLGSITERFKVYGTQGASGANYNFDNYAGNGEYQHYVIPLGQYLSGDKTVLYFTADHDAAPQNGDSFFRNVTVYDAGTCNAAPSINTPDNQTSIVGDAISLAISATDEDGDTLTYSATGLPSGLGIDPSNGEISGVVDAAGTNQVTTSVDDGNGGSAETSFEWTVNDAPPIAINDITTTPKTTGVNITYTASASGGNGRLYSWLFGDGTPSTAPSASASVAHIFTEPGRYLVQVTVTDAAGQEEILQFYQAIYLPQTSNQPTNSTSIIYQERGGNDWVWNVNPDNDSVSVFDVVTNTKVDEIAVGSGPRTLTLTPDSRVWVTNKKDSTLTIISAVSRSVDATIQLSQGSRPYGVAATPTGGYVYVALEGTGQLLKLDMADGSQVGSLDVGSDVRHVAVNADGSRAYVSRFVTPRLPGEETANIQINNAGGEVLVVDAANMTVLNTIKLQVNNNSDFEAGARGVPNYLGAPVISPDGGVAWVPSKQDNILRGGLRDGASLNFEHTVRAISSKIDLGTQSEIYGSRLDHDNSSLASAATFGIYGNYLFVALETSREMGILDAYSGQEIARLDVGRAPQGVAVSPDGAQLFVHNFMDRSIGVYDISQLMGSGTLAFSTLATYDTVASEALTNQILSGKQLFYDAADERLTQDAYMSCASCHNDGGHDGRIWDFTDIGEGLRNTISLNGHGGPEHGRLHWSANFDEIHDFENQIRSLAGGLGLMSDVDFNATTDPLGAPKAGLSNELDALAAYVNSLTTIGVSPNRAVNGSLTSDGLAGRTIFVQKNCASCHSGIAFTDSATDALHDIGTIQPSSGQRAGASLSGIDTPTLRGLWETAPYLHDGSAATIAEAIQAHNNVSVTGTELDQLVAYLTQIDDSELTAPANDAPVIAPLDPQVNIVGDTVSLAITASDPNNDTLTFSATGLPDGLSINANNGTISGAVTDIGTFNPTITVSDNNGGVDSVTVGWVVDEPANVAPVADAGLDQTILDIDNSGSELVTLDGSASADSDGSITTYEWGGINDVVILSEPSPTIDLPIGSYTIVLTVTDDDGATATDSVTITVGVPPNSNPVLETVAAQSNTVGDNVNLTVSATDDDGDTLTFSATGLPDGLTMSSAGVIAGTVTTEGAFNVTVTVDDGNGGSDSASFTWNVNAPANIPPVITNPGGQANTVNDSVNLTVTATDDDGDTLTFSAIGLPTGLSINSSSGTIAGTVTTAGSFNVIVTVDDGNGGTDSAPFSWTVEVPTVTGSTIDVDAYGSAGSENMNLLIDGQVVQSWTTSTSIQIFSYVHTVLVTADQIRVEFTNNGFDTSNNADRNLVVDKIRIDGTVYETEAPNVEGRGVWTGSSCSVVAFHQRERLSCNGYFQFASNAVNLPPTLQNPGTQVNTIGNPVSLSLSASDPNGDALTFGAAGLPGGLTIDVNSGTISGTPTTLGTSNVVATVSDGNGGSDSTSFSWVVNDGTTANCGGLIQEAEDATLSGTFVIGSSAGASGGQYIQAPNGSGNRWNGPSADRADFCFDVPTAGTYRLLGTIQATGGGNNSFYVTIDGQPVDGYLWDTTITGSSYGDDYVAQRGGADPVEFNLSTDQHTVSIYLREDGTILDKLELELVNADQTVTCGGLEQEAEDGSLRGSMVVGTDANASGGQYVHLPNGSGNNLNGPTVPDQAEYCFDVPAAGTYLLQGTILATGGGNNSFYATIDGQPGTGYLWDTAIAPANYIQDYLNSRGQADPVQLSLSAGEHTVIIYPREDGTVLDKLALVDATSVAQAQNRSSTTVNNNGLFGTLRVPSSVTAEPAISGLTVTVRDLATGNIIAQTETSQTGKFYVDGLAEGIYQLQVDLTLADGSTKVLINEVRVDADDMTESSFEIDEQILVADDIDVVGAEKDDRNIYLFLPFVNR